MKRVRKKLAAFSHRLFAHKIAKAMLDSGVISIKKIRVAVVGDKGVGKTSLIQAFKNDEFPLNPVEETEASKMFYVGEQRYLFTLVELHENWELRRGHLFAIDAVLLCYDGEREQEKRLAEKWTPRIHDWLPAARLYLVRTKCDRLYDNFDDGHSPVEVAQYLNAVKVFECSAKEQTGIEPMFKELALAYSAAHPQDKGRPPIVSGEPLPQASDEPKPVTCGLGSAMFSAFSSSLPLIKQAGNNLKEIAWNPDCFPAAKETINSYVPFLFRSRPSYDHKRLSEEHELHEEYLKQVKKDQQAAATTVSSSVSTAVKVETQRSSSTSMLKAEDEKKSREKSSEGSSSLESPPSSK